MGKNQERNSLLVGGCATGNDDLEAQVGSLGGVIPKKTFKKLPLSMLCRVCARVWSVAERVMLEAVAVNQPCVIVFYLNGNVPFPQGLLNGRKEQRSILSLGLSVATVVSFPLHDWSWEGQRQKIKIKRKLPPNNFVVLFFIFMGSSKHCRVGMDGCCRLERSGVQARSVSIYLFCLWYTSQHTGGFTK